MKQKINMSVSIGLKLCIDVICLILSLGIIQRISVHSQNFAIIQNKLATTLKQFILIITGHSEMSKDVLPKKTNFIYQNDLDDNEITLYMGKNYSISLMKQVCSRNINLSEAV